MARRIVRLAGKARQTGQNPSDRRVHDDRWVDPSAPETTPGVSDPDAQRAQPPLNAGEDPWLFRSADPGAAVELVFGGLAAGRPGFEGEALSLPDSVCLAAHTDPYTCGTAPAKPCANAETTLMPSSVDAVITTDIDLFTADLLLLLSRHVS
jgi:hypothetical protein